jgi:hypothetical protein
MLLPLYPSASQRDSESFSYVTFTFPARKAACSVRRLWNFNWSGLVERMYPPWTL